MYICMKHCEAIVTRITGSIWKLAILEDRNEQDPYKSAHLLIFGNYVEN